MPELVPQPLEHPGAMARVSAMVAEAGNQAAMRYLDDFLKLLRGM